MLRPIPILILIAVGLTAFSGPRETAPIPKKPNFVIFLVDDLGWRDGGVFGSDLYETPHIDQLAADGMHFRTGYAACTVCSPTRAALMTGKYPARTHVTDWIRGHQRPFAKLSVPDWTMKLEARHRTIAEALGDAGYRTASIGKWHLMPTGDEDMGEYFPDRHGFDVNIGGNQRGHPGSYFHPYEHSTREGRGIGPIPPGGAEGDYLTDRLSAEAAKLIEGFGSDPFFLYFPFYSVHTPIQAKDEDIEHYRARVKLGMVHADPTYAAMVTSVDRGVGLVRAKLEAMGIADNTVIIFTGDNGGLDRDGAPTENAPVREGKGSAYEGGVRTPAVVYWPGVTPAGAFSDEPVITMDFYSTILEIADVQGTAGESDLQDDGEEIDGVSLVPVLRDPAAQLGREALYWHYPHYHKQGATPYSAIRVGDWRLVEFFEDGRAELYNLKEDVGESSDLAARMPDKAAELKTMLSAWRKEVGAQLPSENPNYDPVKDRETWRDR